MKILKLILIPIIFLVLLLIGLVLHNNMGFSEVTPQEIDLSFDKSIEWLESNKEKILDTHYAILWWMLIQAYEETNDKRLKKIIDEYRDLTFDRYINSPSRYLMYGTKSNIHDLKSAIDGVPDYNVFFNYGFSCDSRLAEEKIVRAQFKTGFCLHEHPFVPACLTHQIFGLIFIKENNCSDESMINQKIDSLIKIVNYQSIFDFRVVDVYLQRVLIHLITDNKDLINKRWIFRILKNQYPDGGWGAIQPLFHIGSEKYMGFSNRIISLGKRDSNFHATAQAIYILALLKNNIIFE